MMVAMKPSSPDNAQVLLSSQGVLNRRSFARLIVPAAAFLSSQDAFGSVFHTRNEIRKALPKTVTCDYRASLGPRVKVVGVGGFGASFINDLRQFTASRIETVLVDTDRSELVLSNAHKKIQLDSSGVDGQATHEGAHLGMENGSDEIRSAIGGAAVLFIVAGMGGESASWVPSLVARMAQEQGILTVAMVTKPFAWEGEKRKRLAANAISELSGFVDAQILVLNDKLIPVLGSDVTQTDAFSHVRNLLISAVASLERIAFGSGRASIDFEEVRTFLRCGGKTIIVSAAANGPDRAHLAAARAISWTRLQQFDWSMTKSVIATITTVGHVGLSEARIAINVIRSRIPPEAKVVYGVWREDDGKDEMRVSLFANEGDGVPRQVI